MTTLEMLVANLYALDQVRLGGGSDLLQSLEMRMGMELAPDVRAAINNVLGKVAKLAR